MNKYVSLPNALLLTSILILTVTPSAITLGLVLVTVLHVNATRFARYQRQAQTNKENATKQNVTAEFETLKTEVLKLVQANNISKLGR